MSEFRALTKTIFNCSVKSRVLSRAEVSWVHCGFHKSADLTC